MNAAEERLTIEEKILFLMLKDRKAVSDFTESHNKPHHFDNRHRCLIDAILEAESNNVMLTRNSFQTHCERIGLKKLEVMAQNNLWNKVKTVVGVTLDDLPSLLNTMRTSYIDRTSIELIESFKKNRQVDAEFAAKDLQEKLKETLDDVETTSPIIHVSVESDLFYDEWEEGVKRRETMERPLIECGIPEIDEPMGCGFAPETLAVVVADVGSYKSTLMLNIAENVKEFNECDVLFVPLEMPRDKIMDKIKSRETQIDFQWIQKPKGVLTDEHYERFREAHRRRKALNGQLALLEFGERTTVGAIRRQIEKHLNHHKPKLVVIDYIANLHPEKSHYGRNDLEIGDMLKDLLKMAKPGVVHKEGFSVLTGAQLGRNAITRLKNQRDQTKQVLGSEDIQGSHQYSADATSIFGLFKNPANINELHIFPIKNRYGKTTYKNGSNKAVLHVRPEISLISSTQSQLWKSSDQDEILLKAMSYSPTISGADDAMFDDAEVLLG